MWVCTGVAPPGFHEAFVRQVFNWFEGCSPGPVTDVSWVEPFMFWVFDTGSSPPFMVDGRWVRVGEDADVFVAFRQRTCFLEHGSVRQTSF